MKNSNVCVSLNQLRRLALKKTAHGSIHTSLQNFLKLKVAGYVTDHSVNMTGFPFNLFPRLCQVS